MIYVFCEWLAHGVMNETNGSMWLQEHRLQEAAGVLVLDLGPPATGRLPRNHASVRGGLHGCHLLQGSDQSYINPWKMICILVKKKSFYRCINTTNVIFTWFVWYWLFYNVSHAKKSDKTCLSILQKQNYLFQIKFCMSLTTLINKTFKWLSVIHVCLVCCF